MTATRSPVESAAALRQRAASPSHPVLTLIARRVGLGLITLFVVSVVIFAATEALPGNAAQAILGHSAAPAQLHSLEAQLHLNRSIFSQYGSWIGGVLSGNLGTSLANGRPVGSVVGPALVNSAILVALAGIVGSVVGITLGALAVTSLPEFVVAIALVILFATVVVHALPAVSLLSGGGYAWSYPSQLVLPVVTLAVVIVPYIMRMTRAATVEALASDYVEMAQLKGLPTRRVLLVHALPNAIPPVVQVLGLSFLYLAGGIVVVEYVYAFPGIGSSLISAVSNRDVPVIQVIVLILGGFYVFVNIASDVVALLASPRRRRPRSS
jgi:peptide/nickel transport system permease protein